MAEAKGEIWRPSPEEALLVRAATGEGERARVAWEQWIAQVDITKVGWNSHQILPLLYKNLQRLGVEHPEVNRIGLFYRHTWAKNLVGMRDLEGLINDFDKQGIDTLVLKGVAMIVRFYKDAGVRSLADFDLLVHDSQANQAMQLLHELGWQNHRIESLLVQDYRTPANGIGFHNPSRQFGCDLHWHVTHLHLSERYDALMWKDAVPIQVGKVQTLALCNEDQLIHVFFNAGMHEGRINLRWLTDALAIFKSEAAIDWPRFVQRCQQMEFGQPVAELLEYLRSEWEVPVPLETIEALARIRVSYSMQKAYIYLGKDKSERSLLDHLWYLTTQYRQSHPHFSPIGFLRFLSYRWKVEGGIKSILSYGFLRLRGVPAQKARELA